MSIFKLLRLFLICYVCCPTIANAQELVVVVNSKNVTDKMTRSEVIDLFMGKYVAFPDGSKAIAVDLDKEQNLKKDFYKMLLGRSLASVNAYWSRLKFTGRAKPPVKLPTEIDIVKYIEKTSNAIGYIPKSKLTKDLKVVYQINE